LRKEILWESETATTPSSRDGMERRREPGANDPAIGYNDWLRLPHDRG
jgi:hypothetical protein